LARPQSSLPCGCCGGVRASLQNVWEEEEEEEANSRFPSELAVTIVSRGLLY